MVNSADELLARYLKHDTKFLFGKYDLLQNGKYDKNNHGAISTDYIGQNYAWPEADYKTREKIFRKHVDFLLCDPNTFAPAFGVEIVKPIAKDNTREADKFMEELFTDAGVPLVHIPSSERYDAGDIIALFQLSVAKIGGTVSLRIDRPTDTVPNCPVCGKMMVLRIHRNGGNSGKKYYGCMDSPRCAGLVPID